MQRLPPAAARIQALNPLVKINVLPPSDVFQIMDPSSSKLAELSVDVVVTGVPSGTQGLSHAWGRDSLVSALHRCGAGMVDCKSDVTVCSPPFLLGVFQRPLPAPLDSFLLRRRSGSQWLDL